MCFWFCLTIEPNSYGRTEQLTLSSDFTIWISAETLPCFSWLLVSAVNFDEQQFLDHCIAASKFFLFLGDGLNKLRYTSRSNSALNVLSDLFAVFLSLYEAVCFNNNEHTLLLSPSQN